MLKIIISGAAGLGDASGFELIKKFADHIGVVSSHAQLWIPAGLTIPIRQTGTTVKPKILPHAVYPGHPAPGRHADLRHYN